VVRQLVTGAAAGREVRGQDVANGGDGIDEAFRCLSAADGTGELIDDGLPGARRDALIDRLVGNDFGIALGDRHEEQHAGASGSRVQVLH
jgi:hypothetical protein